MLRGILAALLVVLAGCTGGGMVDGTVTETTSTADTRPLTNQTAVDRAVAAEKERLRNALSDDDTYSDVSVPGYGTVETTVLAHNESAIRVEVAIPVSYQYACSDNAGYVDGRIVAVYLVDNEGATGLQTPQPICG